MNINFVKNNKSFLLLSLVISSILALASLYTFIPLALLIFLIFLFFFKQKFILLVTIIFFLVLTGEELEKLRTILILILISTLLLLFVKKFGLNIFLYPKVPNSIIYFLIFLFITLLISTIFSIDPFNALLSIFRLLVFFFVCYLYYSLIVAESTFDHYLFGIFISMMLVGISILIDISKTGFTLFLVGGTLIRYGGIYENPNYVGLLLLITIPMNVALFFRNYQRPILVKSGLSILLIISLLLLFVSNSRSSIAGTIIALVVTLAIINRKLLLRYLIVTILISIVLLIFTDIDDYLELYFRMERIGNREHFWNAGLSIIKDYPILGIGPGLFDKYFFTYASSKVPILIGSSNWIVGSPHPHNFFLLFTAENGILGFISAIYFFILFFYFCLKTLSVVRKDKTKDYFTVVTVIGIGVGILFRAFFEVTGIISYGFITRDLPFWILFVIIIYIYQKNPLQDQYQTK